MSRSFCVNLIINYYDSVISEIDVYTEQLLETIDPNELADKERIGKIEIKSQLVLSRFEKNLIPVEPKYIPGVTRTVDYINSIRQEMIDRVQKCQQETLDFYHRNRKDLEMDAEKLKRQLFGKAFCFLLTINKIQEGYQTSPNNCLFKLYLIVVDYYLDPFSIEYVSSLATFVTDCLIYQRGNQHLIDIRLNDLLASTDIKFEMRFSMKSYAIDLSPSSAFNFSNLTTLEIGARWCNLKLQTIGPFPHLKKLSLAEFKIENDSAFANLINLTHLTLKCVVIKNFQFNIHQRMPNLEVVHFSNVKFNNAELIQFEELDKLQDLTLDFKNIVYQDGSAINFEEHIERFANSYVTHFDISYHKFSGYLPILFFPNVKHLYITGSYLDSFSEGLIFDSEGESKLETLNLDETSFTEALDVILPLCKNLKSLSVENFGGGEFSLTDDEFIGVPQLEMLHINGNLLYSPSDNLPTLIMKVLMNLPNLNTLCLLRSHIKELHPDCFNSNPKLTYLDLSENQLVLKKGDLRTLSNLEYLNLSNNQMKKLEEGVFLGLNSLEELDLKGNELDEASLRQLKDLNSLKILNLEPHLKEPFFNF